jgi:ribonuclease HI
MLLFIAAASTSLVIFLHFDGSFRPPRDPIPGFTYSRDVFDNAPLYNNSEKLASCSSSISILSSPCCSGVGDKKETRIAIGGRYLPNHIEMSSAMAEYEGLLLGLDWLMNTSPNLLLSNYYSIESHQFKDTTLIIRGDCKLVIDQLNSGSNPRKMEKVYNSALYKLDCIRELYPSLNVCFEHVPREDNTLCDAVCNLITNQKQKNLVKTIHDLILLGDSFKGRSNLSTKKKFVTSTSVHLNEALDEIRNNSQLCHSSRLALACVLVRESILQRDVEILKGISRFFLDMARRWSKFYYSDDDSFAVGVDALRKASSACDKLTTHFSVACFTDDLCGHDIKSVFDFCTNNKSCDISADLSTSALMHPYTDTSVIIGHFERDNRSKDLTAYAEKVAMHQIICEENIWRTFG